MPEVKSNIKHITTADSARVDSTAADSLKALKKHYTPKYAAGFPDSSGNNLAIQAIGAKPVMTVPPHSSADVYRYKSPLYDNGTVLLVLAVLFTIAVSYGKGYKYIADFFHNMFSVRKRQNVFEDHTVKETQIMLALIANTCIFSGIILYQAFTLLHPEAMVPEVPVFRYVGSLIAFMAFFMLVQLGIYYLLGYIFADKVSTKLWIDGFKASQSLLGIILAPVAFVMLIYPATTSAMLIVAAILYFLARLVFICKAFRIFFNDLPSSLYFILYLCSLEIVPVVLSFAGAMKICIILQAV